MLKNIWQHSILAPKLVRDRERLRAESEIPGLRQQGRRYKEGGPRTQPWGTPPSFLLQFWLINYQITVFFQKIVQEHQWDYCGKTWNNIIITLSSIESFELWQGAEGLGGFETQTPRPPGIPVFLKHSATVTVSFFKVIGLFELIIDFLLHPMNCNLITFLKESSVVRLLAVIQHRCLVLHCWNRSCCLVIQAWLLRPLRAVPRRLEQRGAPPGSVANSERVQVPNYRARCGVTMRTRSLAGSEGRDFLTRCRA